MSGDIQFGIKLTYDGKAVAQAKTEIATDMNNGGQFAVASGRRK